VYRSSDEAGQQDLSPGRRHQILTSDDERDVLHGVVYRHEREAGLAAAA
jgi:hypothetical protein